MAWRPTNQLIEGYLDNSVPGTITGQLRFSGMSEPVWLKLKGDFHRDIRGAILSIKKRAADERPGYLEGFAPLQEGDAGDITAGLPPVDYVNYPYIEWYSHQNGRVVLELEPDEVDVLGVPFIAANQQPVDRAKQHELMTRFLTGIVEEFLTQDSD